MATRVGIALGANLGDRLAQIQSARDLLLKLSSVNAPCLQAPIYHSEPLDCPDGAPDFYNTVIEINYAGTAEELLTETQNIEQQLGRDAIHEHNTPRMIDLDLLYFGNNVIHSEGLTIPHPELAKRNFVLQPLADIRPDLILPNTQITVSDHLDRLDSSEPPLKIAHSTW